MPPLFAIGTAAMVLIGLGGAAFLFFFMGVGVYNTLVTLRNRYKNAFSQIDVQLKRRYDLIPNLVETVKGYMRHESETLEAVINARNTAVTASQRAAGSPGDPTSMNGLNAGRRPAQWRARPAVRPFRGVSRPQGQPEHALAFRKSSPPPRTRSRLPARRLTTPSRRTTPRVRSSPIISSPASVGSCPLSSSRPNRPRSARLRAWHSDRGSLGFRWISSSTRRPPDARPGS